MEKNQFAVIGLGRFGSSLAIELVSLGYEVLGIDRNEEMVQELTGRLTYAVEADATDENTLRSLGVRNIDCAVVAIGDDIQASILTAILLKEIGVKKVVAKAQTELHGKVLKRIGIDHVIFPERDMGVRMAHQLVSPNLLDYIELSDKYTIAEFTVPSSLSGQSLQEVDIRAQYGCSIVAINKQTEMIIAPRADDIMELHDVLVVIGTKEQIEQFERATQEG